MNWVIPVLAAELMFSDPAVVIDGVELPAIEYEIELGAEFVGAVGITLKTDATFPFGEPAAMFSEPSKQDYELEFYAFYGAWKMGTGMRAVRQEGDSVWEAEDGGWYLYLGFDSRNRKAK